MKGYYKIFAVILSLLIVLIIGTGLVILSGNKIVSNVFVGGVDLGRLTKEEALSNIKVHFDENIKNTSIHLVHADKSYDLKYHTINFSYDYEKAIEDAYSIARRGNIITRYSDGLKTWVAGKNIALDYNYDENIILEFVEGIAEDINTEPLDATIRLEANNFILTDEKQGRKLDLEKCIAIINEQIRNNDISVIKLPVILTEVKIKKADLEKITHKLGEFSTSFNSSNLNRTHNIKLATNSVSKQLIQPKQVFSLNEAIGPRTAKFGYKSAIVLVNNEYIDGIGGGICQVSSTLYNAALLSNLKIVERRNHSLPSAYIALGRDATIAGDSIDLKFENNYEYPLYIHGEVKGGNVKFSIYGKNDNPQRTIKIKTEIVKTMKPKIEIIEDESLSIGEEIIEKKAQTGYQVKSYRIVMEAGKQVSSELLFTDTYTVSNGIKRIGVKPSEEIEPFTDMFYDDYMKNNI